MTATAKPCPRCKRDGLTPEPWHYGYIITCPDCYDGAADGCRDIGMGRYRADAIADWSAFVETTEAAPAEAMSDDDYEALAGLRVDPRTRDRSVHGRMVWAAINRLGFAITRVKP